MARWHKQWRIFLPLFAVGLAAMLANGHSRAADPAVAPDDAVPIRFHRVFVPKSEKEEFDRLINGYLPMKRAEFDDLVKSLSAARRALPRNRAFIEQAVYQARLAGSQLVDGVALVDIHHDDDQSVPLDLTGLRLAIGKATWEGAEMQPALLATGAKGAPLLLVDRSGRLRMTWSLRGQVRPFGEVEFDLKLPPSPASRLVLDLPEGFVPRVEGAAISPLVGETAAQADREPSRRQWSIDLGSRRSAILQVVRSETPKRQLVLLRQHAFYDLNRSGGELAVDLHLDVHHEPLRQLVVAWNPALAPPTATLGGKIVRTSLVDGDDTAGRPPQLTLHFTKPLLGTDRVVRLETVIKTTTGRLWTLPHVKVVGANWQEETSTLRVHHPQQLGQLALVRCRQTETTQLAAPSRGEVISIQHHADDAVVRLVVAPPPPRLAVAAGTTINFDAVAADAEFRAEITSLAGEHFAIRFHVPEAWTVESVKTDPASVMQGYDLSREGNQKLVHLRLATTVTPEQMEPLRLTVNAHRWLPAQGTPLEIGDVRLARFSDSEMVQQLISLPTGQLQLSGDVGLLRFDPLQLTEEQNRLVVSDPARLVFADEPQADRLRLILNREQPRYFADIHVSAVVDAASITESYQIQCRPQSSQVGRLLVHLVPAGSPDLQWSIVGEGAQSLSAVKLDAQQQQTHGISVGETWEITLKRPRNVPFDVRATRLTALSGRHGVGLAAVPLAETQTGTVEVAATAGVGVAVENDGLKPIPAESPPADRFSDTRARFRYIPSQEARLQVARSQKDDQQPSAWAWTFHLATHLTAHGSAHTATYRLENTGRRQLEIRLPPTSDFVSLRIDGDDVRPSSQTDNTLIVALPAGKRYPKIEVAYSDQSGNLKPALGQVHPSVPEVSDLPILTRRWTLWLPPGYAALREQSGSFLQQPLTIDSCGKRLFGPLWRGTGRAPFSLFAADDWANLTSDTRAGAMALRDADRCLDALGQYCDGLSKLAEREANWRELLANYGRAAKNNLVPLLLVDVRAVEAAGIVPASEIQVATDGDDTGFRRTAIELLQQSNLALISSGGMLILTSPDSLQFHGAELLSSPYRRVALRATGSPQAAANDGLLAIDDWLDESRQPLALWIEDGAPAGAAMEHIGWTAYAWELPIEPTPAVRIYQPALVEAAGWAAVLIAAALVFWFAVRRPIRLAGFVGLSAATALLAPAALMPISSGAMLGVLLATGLVFALGRPALRNSIRRESSTAADSPSTVHAALFLFAAGLLTSLSAATADEAPAPPLRQEPSPRLYAVIVPVDEAQQPTGGYVYLPPPLYDALHRRQRALQVEPPAWHLLSAQYDCALVRQVDDELAIDENLTATFDIEVLRIEGESAQIVVPLRREDCDLAVDGVQVDGESAAVRFSDDGAALLVKAEEPGRRRLRVAFRPRRYAQSDFKGIDIGIPQLARSQLRLRLPRDAEGIEIPSALGTVDRSISGGEITAQLGPANRLAIRWPTVAAAARRQNAGEVQQLTWLRIRPGSVVVETKFHIKRPGRIDGLQLLADQRLRMLPFEGGHQVQERLDSGGETKVIHVQLQSPVESETDLHFSFLLTGASGIGNLRLPQLEPSAEMTASRMLAVSVSPLLAATPPPQFETVEVARFLAAWGAARPAEIDFVNLLPPGEKDWHLSTEPRAPQTTAKLTTRVGYSSRAVSLDWHADLVTNGGYVFQHNLRAPKGLQVDRVELHHDGGVLLPRWSQDDDGEISIRMRRRVTGPHELRIVGRLPLRYGRAELPQFALLGAIVSSSEQRVYRQTDVAVKLVGPTESKDFAGNEQGLYVAPWGRLVAALNSADAADKRPQVLVRANTPRTHCVAMTTLEKSANQWTAQIDCVVQSSAGVIDELWFDSPISWSPPFTVEPAFDLQLVVVPGYDRRRIVVRPSQAVPGPLRVTIRGRLEPRAAGERISVPNIEPLGLDKVEQLVVVPQQADSQRFSWSPSHLQAAEIPADFNDANLPDDPLVWRVVDPRYRAAIKSFEQSAGVPPQVRLADIHFAWNRDGSCRGMAAFDLEPAGLSSCILRMPETFQLMQATVADLPATLVSLGDNQWRLSLGPDQLPQRITVVYTGRLAGALPASGRSEIPSPRLVDLSVERTLWTLYGPEHSGKPQLVEPDRVTTARRQWMERFETTSQLIARASDIALESPRRDIDAWYLPWARRFVSAREAVRMIRSADQRQHEIDSERVDALDGEQQEVAERLGATQLLDLAAPQPGHAEIWADIHHSAPLRCAFAGTGEGRVEMAPPPPLRSGLFARWLAAGVLLAVSAFVYLFSKHTPVPEWLARWPQAAGVLIGLAWWMWLSPSLLGWAIVLLSVVTALRRPWKTIRVDSESGDRTSLSAVLRNPSR